MGASVTLITPQTFEQARQNGKVGKKWTGQGISIKTQVEEQWRSHLLIDGRNMEAPFIVGQDKRSNLENYQNEHDQNL
jgi:hypothetical protein